MGVREAIDRHKGWAVGIAAVGVLTVAVFAWRQVGSSSGVGAVESAQAFYSTDDGATYFSAPADLIPPFDHEGKTACRAAVFTCDGGKTKFVGYLEKYPAAAKARLDAARDAGKRGDRSAAPAATAAGDIEIKKPGAAATWVNRRSREAAQVLNVTCPHGTSGQPVLVTP